MRPDLRTVALALGLTVGLGCNNPPGSAPATPATPAEAAAVAAVKPEKKSLKRVVEQPGAVQPDEETQLFARVLGYVGKVHTDIGQPVHGPKYDAAGKMTDPGQVLAEITVPEMEEELNQKRALTRQAEAEVEQDQKALAAAEAHIATTEATVVEAKAVVERWDSEAKRTAGLAKSGVLDLQVRDETLNQFKAAGARLLSVEAAVLKAKADRDKAKADVRAAEARVAVAEAEARRLEALLGYAKIRAPYDGVVTRRKVNTGDYVHPGGKGEWLFTVARLDPVRLVVNVPEADASLVQKGGDVSLTVQALKGPPLTGKVTRTSWALEPGSRTLRAEIDMPNADGRLRPGMYVYARLMGQLPEEWVLPAAAVVKQGDAMVCFVIEGDKVTRTPVLVGHADGKFVEVLRRQQAGSPPVWVEFSGKEAVASKAAGLVEGQQIKIE